VEEEVEALLVRDVGREVVDRVPAVAQDAVDDAADVAREGDDALETFLDAHDARSDRWSAGL
jgi:hypothetical protein